MTELFTLGELYPSDFLKEVEQPRSEKVEMKLIMDDRGLVRLERTADSNVMYGKYWYRSGINATMKAELKDIVDSITKIYPLNNSDVWLDIACNDGTLLSFVPNCMTRIGVDPADNSYLTESEEHADMVIQDFFSAKAYKESVYGNIKAKVITSIAMFYDLQDPDKFIEDVKEVLDDNGLWVMQLSYTPLMIKQLAFDNICHEHIYYYSLSDIRVLLRSHGFEILDCQLNEINGGSFRLYIVRNNCKPFMSKPELDICDFRVSSTLCHERQLNLDWPETWFDFFDRIRTLKEQTVSFIKKAKSEGKAVWGYGASTKGNTLLQYFGLDDTLVTGIADRSSSKWGLRTVGTNIPIYSESEMRLARPDYLLILPWHFINEFQQREREYLNGGGKFIVPCPTFEII